MDSSPSPHLPPQKSEVTSLQSSETRAQEQVEGNEPHTLMSGFVITLHYTALHYTALHYITPHCITLHYTALHYTTLHCTILHCITSHCITLHYTALHCITLHYNILELTQRLAAREEEVSRLQGDIGASDASSAGV